MIRVSFKTHNGHYLMANDATTNYAISATPNGVGPWEVFTLFLSGGRDTDSISSGDKVHLQTDHGRFVMTQGGGGSAINGEATWPSRWETFTIEKLSGDGAISYGDRVTLRTYNGVNFLMARDGGGGDVTAESQNRAEWETYVIEFWSPMLVRLRSFDEHYLAAEDGGGREITATRNVPLTWETFRLVNRSRALGLRDGDSVGLQTWNGKFVSAENGGGGSLAANRNRVASWETFTINKPGGGDISIGDRVYFRTQNAVNYVMAQNGGGSIVSASSGQAREWETFQIEAAELNPIPFSSAPSYPTRVDWPWPLPHPKLTGRRKLVAFLIGFQDRPVDDTISNTDIQRFFFWNANSIRAWVERSSFGNFTIEGEAYGPFTVPWDYVSRSDQDYFSGLLQLGTGQGLSWRNMDTDRNGIISGEELLLAVIDCTNAYGGGNSHGVSFTYDGVKYDGRILTVGIYTRGGPVQGIAQLEGIFPTITHELSHVLFGLPDRYYQPFPPRGDVVAVSEGRAQWETLTVWSLTGDRFRLQAYDGSFLVPDMSIGRYLNFGGTASDSQGEFVIERLGGGAAINHGDQIHLKSTATNRYVMARGGGGGVVQVIAEGASIWETFVIERENGPGPVGVGDRITLRTGTNNQFGEGFYLMAEPNGRHSDQATLDRGWWIDWAKSLPGDGVGGDYDIMDDNFHRGMHAAYDRIQKGWIVPKVLTPEDKAYYMLAPSIDSPESFILWDPKFPEEWYVVENRQRRPGLDEVPSTGLIISWVNEHPSYWMRWKEPTGTGRYPAVISAAAPAAPPNDFASLVLLRNRFYKRRDPNTAFRSGSVLLRRGDGSPSRFRLFFKELTDERVAFCIL